MEIKVSVIVPIYNVEPYLEQCVSSIRNQTLQEIEIILVDDGSPDHCPEMCDRFALEDDRIHVIHQKNQGVSTARNNGLKIATGEWIAFCDPDDWMDETELSILYDAAMRENADVAMCSYYRTMKNGGVVPVKLLTTPVSSRVFAGNPVIDLAYECMAGGYLREQGKQVFAVTNRLVVPWGRIYRAKSVRGIKFPEGLHPHEDLIYSLKAFCSVSKVVVLNKPLHYYRVDVGVTSHFQKNAAVNLVKGLKEAETFMKSICGQDEFEMLANQAECVGLSAILKQYFFNPNHPDSYAVRKRELKQHLENYTMYWRHTKTKRSYTPKQKAVYILLRLHMYWPFELYRLLRKYQASLSGEKVE